ncbi:unnamed protein product [Phytophthora fragariaefolia]|uniref:Unnamed protein product n=1 Tax=Phytophthora fragariaefolia TaxID=1490495 RepID=A0A9W6XR11_9STRA|nr:unnamed protein product [Phytophthora fragariaefolia]
MMEVDAVWGSRGDGQHERGPSRREVDRLSLLKGAEDEEWHNGQQTHVESTLKNDIRRAERVRDSKSVTILPRTAQSRTTQVQRRSRERRATGLTSNRGVLAVEEAYESLDECVQLRESRATGLTSSRGVLAVDEAYETSG